MSDPVESAYRLPDGIGRQHFERDEGMKRHASVLSVIILGCLMAVALSGVLGGGFNARLSAGNDRVALTYFGPTIIRNGMFFEAHAIVTAKQPIKKLVVAVDQSLIHDLTMNSMVPQPGDETFKDGAFRFSYDKLDKGDSFNIKFDFQINPSLFAGTSGQISVYDDKTLLAALPVTIAVLP
ncbi:MAG TPA: hypothetical protein VFJ18_03040 [Pararhizobium sp.]|nr:hypothetical protein [Pararhizobium sp.]